VSPATVAHSPPARPGHKEATSDWQCAPCGKWREYEQAMAKWNACRVTARPACRQQLWRTAPPRDPVTQKLSLIGIGVVQYRRLFAQRRPRPGAGGCCGGESQPRYSKFYTIDFALLFGTYRAGVAPITIATKEAQSSAIMEKFQAQTFPSYNATLAYPYFEYYQTYGIY